MDERRLSFAGSEATEGAESRLSAHLDGAPSWEASSQQDSEAAEEGVDLSRASPEFFQGLRSSRRPLLTYEGFERLQVISVARASISTCDLEALLPLVPQLQKLDASYCGLTSLPNKRLWATLGHLRSLLLHRNSLLRWQDVECAIAPPALVWLTLYENPIASQPEFRVFAVEIRALTRIVVPCSLLIP